MLKLRNSNIFIISLLIIVFLSSCTSQEKVREGNLESDNISSHKLIEIKIYFTKSSSPQNIVLVPIKRKVLKEGSIVAESIKELFLGPTKVEEMKNIMTEIPIGTRLINLEESEDDILINISSQFLAGGGSAAMQLRYLQIYKTLKRIAPYKDIYLQVDGKVVKTIGGEGLEVAQPLTKIEDYTREFKDTKTVQP